MKTVAGLTYNNPRVLILQESGLGVSEIAARTCYDSFATSENTAIQEFDSLQEPNEFIWLTAREKINGIDSSDLLMRLAWVAHHHSILEHTTLSFHIQGTSRGVLQEFARHRIQAISVRSTRYTMSGIINAFIASKNSLNPKEWFCKKLVNMDMFVVQDKVYQALEAGQIYEKLLHQMILIGKDEFYRLSIAKSSLTLLGEHVISYPETFFNALQTSKKKRNVGDSFKHIVTDNWKVDLVSTMNLRALKNFLDLRDSGAAYFGIVQTAQAMKAAMPEKYRKLIIK